MSTRKRKKAKAEPSFAEAVRKDAGYEPLPPIGDENLPGARPSMGGGWDKRTQKHLVKR